MAGDSDFAPGDVRYSFLVISHDARPVERALARVWVAHSQSGRPFESATARLETIGPPGAGEAAFGGVGRIYVVQLRITRPGRYWLVAEPVGAKIQALGTLDVKARADSVAKPQPHRDRPITQVSSRPGHPSGLNNPTRPMTWPLAFSTTAHCPYPRRCQWPTIIATFRHATVIPPGAPVTVTYFKTSGS